MLSPEERRLADAVKNACLIAARHAAEDAGISGLCWEGRFEAALDAIRAIRVDDSLLSQPVAGGADAQSAPPGPPSRE